MRAPASSGSARQSGRYWAGWPGIAAVMLAILLWLLVKFNQSYTTAILYPAQIVNLPTQVAPDEGGFKQVKVNCEGLGSRLFVAWIRRNRDTLVMDYDGGNIPKPTVRLGAEEAAFLRRRLPSGVRMLSYAPDSLAIRLETRTNKRVALEVATRFQPPYGYRVDSVALRGSDSVRLTGPSALLDAVDRWQTKASAFPVGTNPNIYRVELDTLNEVEIMPSSVLVYVRPRRYAEVEIVATLSTNDPPKNNVVKYFPPTLTLYCTTPLADLQKIPRRIDIAIPFDQLDPSSGVLFPDLKPFLPSSVELIHWEPRTPSFVVQDTSALGAKSAIVNR
ncbi:MAG: hypothetical protein AB8F95_03400 [Bacteroidia bacterium]